MNTQLKARTVCELVNQSRLLAINAVILFSAGHVSAQTVTLPAAQDTFITQNSRIGGPNSSHGFDTFLHLVRGGIGVLCLTLIGLPTTSHSAESETAAQRKGVSRPHSTAK